MKKQAITIVSRYFAPAFKAGGPSRSLGVLFDRLSDRYVFSVCCLDRDSRDHAPFKNAVECENGRGPDNVQRLSPGVSACSGIARIVWRNTTGLLYLNSFFDPVFAIWPMLIVRCLGRQGQPVLLAPRGELAAGALRQKAFKKRIYLAVARVLGLYRNCWWHASGDQERRDILAAFPGMEPRRIFTASNMIDRPGESVSREERPAKQPGRVRAVFVGRITPVKNLMDAIRFVGGMEGVSLDIIGPVSDEAYWEQCRKEIARFPKSDIRHVGPVPHDRMRSMLGQFDLLLAPSEAESFGHVIVEALQAGCPVLVSDRTPWKGLEGEQAGWVLPLGVPDEWVRIIETVRGMPESVHRGWREGAGRVGLGVAGDTGAEADTRRMFETVLGGAESMEKLPVTVLMMTLNAESILPEALESVIHRVQEVVVVDSRSTDRTIDIALQYGARVVQRTFTNFGDHWRWITQRVPVSTPWTFILASDERMTDSLYRSIRAACAGDGSHAAYTVRWRLWFMGQPLHVITDNVRLFRTGRFRIGETVCNEQYLIDGTTGSLDGVLEHKDSPTLLEWQNKQNIYSTMEAIAMVNKKGGYAVEPRLFGSRLERRMFIKKHFFDIPFRYQLIFIYNWLGMGAWRDGRVGLGWAHLRAEVYRMRELKALEMRLTGCVPKIPTLPCGEFDSRIMRSPLQRQLLPETVSEWEKSHPDKIPPDETR